LTQQCYCGILTVEEETAAAARSAHKETAQTHTERHTHRERSKETETMKKTVIEKQADKEAKRQTTKKRHKEAQKRDRVHIAWNTGTRTHKSKKDYNRQRDKRQAEREEE